MITTISEFRQYIAVEQNTHMATLQPYIDEAVQLYLIDLLGQEFYDELLPLYLASVQAEGPVALSADNAALLPYIQRCLAYYSMLQAIPHLSATFGELGIRQHRGDDSDPAPRWLQEKLMFNALKNGDLHADILLKFLEDNATEEVYQTWFESDANTKNSGYIVRSVEIASRHIDINASRRVFLKLRPKMRELERKVMPKLIGQEQYDALVAQLQDPDPEAMTAEYADLIERIEPIVCKRALYMQLPFMRIQINENGVFLYSGTDEIFKPGQLATDADIKILRQQLMDGDLGYLADEQELRQFILDNIDDYPLIEDSTVYTTQPDPGPTWESKNDPDNKFYSV